jgi:thymidylate synthase
VVNTGAFLFGDKRKMQQYVDLVNKVLLEGTLKENRTGVDTIGIFGHFYKHDLKNGFPLLTTKRMKWEHIVLENLWFLSGDTDINFLKNYNIKFWDPWVDADNRVPSAYGNFWRHFPVHRQMGGVGRGYASTEIIASFNDQIEFAVKELRNNPLSRRIVITAWAPANAQTSKLPPCHLTWVLNTQKDKTGELCLNLALLQRSCDIALGVPYNLAGYSFLLELMAHLTHLKVGEFAHTLVDAHIYVNHMDDLRVQVSRPALPLPKLRISPDIKELSDIEEIIASRPALADILEVFKLENYEAHPPVTYQVAV